MVLKLYVNAIQSPVHYYQIIIFFSCRHRGLNPRRTFCAIIFQWLSQPYYLSDVVNTEYCIRNKEIRNQLLFHVSYLSDDRVQLKFCESTVKMLYANGQQSRVQPKIRRVQKFSKCCIELCIYRTNISINWLQLVLQQHYGECAMIIVLVAWVAHKAGMQYSLRSSSLATVPYSIKNPITCFQLSAAVQQSITKPCILLKKWEFTTVSQYESIYTVSVTYSKVVNLLLHHSVPKMRNCCSQLHCIEFNVTGTNFSIK